MKWRTIRALEIVLCCVTAVLALLMSTELLPAGWGLALLAPIGIGWSLLLLLKRCPYCGKKNVFIGFPKDFYCTGCGSHVKGDDKLI